MEQTVTKQITTGWRPYTGLSCGHCSEDLPIGSKVNCTQCDRDSEDAAWLGTVDYSVISHMRYDTRFGGRYHVYQPDETSPTGVRLLRSIDATPAIEAIINNRRLIALSPTER